MVPCTLTNLIAPSTFILTSVDITLESETHLRKSNVPEYDGTRKECDKEGESMVGLPLLTLIHPQPGMFPLQV